MSVKFNNIENTDKYKVNAKDYNMVIGYDKNGTELKIGDKCKFSISHKSNVRFMNTIADYIGTIVYDEDSYSYAFEMIHDTFPIVLMSDAIKDSIEKL